MEKIRRGGNAYFDTFYIYHQRKYIGILEDHCRGVKQRYFVAWAGDPCSSNTKYKTENFDAEEDALEFIAKYGHRIAS